MRLKIRQIGLNLLVIKDNKQEVITFPKDYNFDKLFSLAYKIESGNKTAESLFNKEISKYRKEVKKDSEILLRRFNKKLIQKELKKIQSFDYSSLPVFIPQEWKDVIDSKEDSSHIENFLMWLSLCEYEHTRENFLKSFDTNYCYITPQGYIASLRQMWKKEDNDPLYDFVQSKWKQVKTIWKKSPKNYGVYFKDNIYLASVSDPDNKEMGWDFEGNLDDLYHNYVPEKKTTYISNYAKRNSHILQEEWSVGDVITMPDKATHKNVCGIQQYHFLINPFDVLTGVHGTYGDTIVLTLVNPARLINIEHGYKYTADEFYFCSVMEKEDVKKQFKEQWGLFEHDYLEKDIAEIKASIIETKEKDNKINKKLKVSRLKEQLKPFKVLNNKTNHLDSVLYNQILENRIKLLN